MHKLLFLLCFCLLQQNKTVAYAFANIQSPPRRGAGGEVDKKEAMPIIFCFALEFIPVILYVFSYVEPLTF